MSTDRAPENKGRQIATSENTVFLTVAAYEDYESQTSALRQSAADHHVPLIFYDKGESWKGFYHHKIERMCGHLCRLHDMGKRFAFILDSRDVVFIDPIDSILEKFNALYNGRVIFNNDVPGKIWPSHKDDLARTIEAAMGTEHVRLNAGALAGDIVTILNIQRHVIALRHELKTGRPRPGIADSLYREIGTAHLDDDQHLYQMCLTYYPELFRIDCDKELFAILTAYPKDNREHSDDPRRHDVINNAAIVHSPWLSCGQEWQNRAFQNRWKR